MLNCSSRHTLAAEQEPLDMTVAEEEEQELLDLQTFSPITATQRSVTSSPAPERSATPPPLPGTSTGTSTPPTTTQRPLTPSSTMHPRVQALISESQQQRQKRRRTVSPTSTEQQLLDIITQPATPAPPNVPRPEDEMYYFALSLIPKLNRLLPRSRTRAQIQILTLLDELECNDEDQRQQAAAAHTIPSRIASQQPQTAGFYPFHPYHEEETLHPHHVTPTPTSGMAEQHRTTYRSL